MNGPIYDPACGSGGLHMASTVADLADELRKAHGIIAIALNCIEGDTRRTFTDDVRAAGLEGEGVTRANERLAPLERLSAHVSTLGPRAGQAA